jgi:Putative beta-lactamase-inhibitor-like, PepSY-like
MAKTGLSKVIHLYIKADQKSFLYRHIIIAHNNPTECLPFHFVGYMYKYCQNKKYMKKFIFSLSFLAGTMTSIAVAQDLQSKDVPEAVKTAFTKKYPDAKKVSWEKEKGNYEANWGGKSGEDSSVTFTPSAIFVEIVVTIPVSQLPSGVAPYVNNHYKGAKIREAGKVTDAAGRQMYEAEIKGKDLIFDENGVFLKED